jgi:hypothetical protein
MIPNTINYFSAMLDMPLVAFTDKIGGTFTVSIIVAPAKDYMYRLGGLIVLEHSKTMSSVRCNSVH